MFKKFYINNFRCFNNIVIEDLKTFNIILGKNNVGKTAFLESLFLHIGSHNPEITFRIDSFRGESNKEMSAISLWAPLFYNLDTERPIVLISHDELARKATSEISIVGKKTTKAQVKSNNVGPYGTTDYSKSLDRLKLSFTDPRKRSITAYAILDGTHIKYERPEDLNFKRGMFVSTWAPRSFEQEAQRFSKLQIESREGAVVDALKKIEPRLTKLIIVPIGDQSAIYADIGLNRAIAINYLGEGIVRLLQILLAMAETENGIVLIDELDRGFHYEFYSIALEIILDFARKLKIQIFTTTHSRELIVAASKIFQKIQSDDLLTIRFDRTDKGIKPIYYSPEQLKLVKEEGWEIR